MYLLLAELDHKKSNHIGNGNNLSLPPMKVELGTNIRNTALLVYLVHMAHGGMLL